MTSLLVEVASSPWSQSWHERADEALKTALSGGASGRYQQQARTTVDVRAPALPADGAPFAALIHPENGTSGAYAGMSFVLFPSQDSQQCLISLVVGTLGLGPDARILGRPGHVRKVSAMTRWLNDRFGGGKQIAWSKSDPTAIDQVVPDAIKRQYPEYARALDKYGNVIYAICVPPNGDAPAARDALWAFFDLAMEERGARLMRAFEAESSDLKGRYLGKLMPNIAAAEAVRLLRHRRYVVVEGPPGTGKTRLAEMIKLQHYDGRGMTVQFHPGTTYESFVGGLVPDPDSGAAGLKFVPRPGYLMQAIDAAAACAPQPFLLHLDEINRADLSKVLGEAIYLLEPGAEIQRVVKLAHRFPRANGQESDTLSVPDNLHILGTMNSADRSIAILDVAIRRRFGFLKLWPQRSVLEETNDSVSLEAFDRLASVFVEWASEDAFALMPGHSYFLTPPDGDTIGSLRQNLVPLLEEYLAQGYLPGFAEQVRAYVQWIESL